MSILFHKDRLLSLTEEIFQEVREDKLLTEDSAPWN